MSNALSTCSWNNCPESIKQLVTGIVDKYREIIGEDLAGFYLHGSLAMGCFNPQNSDIDFLAVVTRPISTVRKKKIIRYLLDIRDYAPPKGIEMSIVTEETLSDFRYPTPFELHYSNDWYEKYRNGQVDYTEQRYDSDLAAHFMITRNRGICLYGKPVGEIFPEITEGYYLKSILDDVRAIFENIELNSVYTVLNLCRVISYTRDGLITSKKEGGDWALENMPEKYHSLIKQALKAYAGQEEKEFDTISLREFAEYMKAELLLPDSPL